MLGMVTLTHKRSLSRENQDTPTLVPGLKQTQTILENLALQKPAL